MAEPVYQREIQFLKRKAPTLKIEWQEKPVLDQIISPAMLLSDAQSAYDKLSEIFKAKKTVDNASLLQLVKIFKKENQSRVLIAVPLLLKFFGDEMTDFSGGGGRKFKVDTTPPELRPPGMGRR